MTWTWRTFSPSADVTVPHPRGGEGSATMSPEQAKPPHAAPQPGAWPSAATAQVMVVDGDQHVRSHLRELLQAEGHEVIEAPDGPEALELFEAGAVDLVLLELVLPGMSGFKLCRAIRDRSDAAIVVVTALREEVDTVLALEIGADDYITKPFLDRELTLRVKAVLRRARHELPARAPAPAASGRMHIDPQLQCVSIDGRQISLSPRELRLLELLLRGGGRLLTRSEIVGAVWGADGNTDSKTLDALVRRLRGKIEADAHNPTLLLTVRGRGYRLSL